MSLKEKAGKFFQALLLPMDELNGTRDPAAQHAAGRLFDLVSTAMQGDTLFEASDMRDGVFLIVTRANSEEFHITSNEFDDSIIVLKRDEAWRSIFEPGGEREVDLLSEETLLRLYGYIHETMIPLTDSERQAAEALLGVSRENVDDETQRYM